MLSYVMYLSCQMHLLKLHFHNIIIQSEEMFGVDQQPTLTRHVINLVCSCHYTLDGLMDQLDYRYIDLQYFKCLLRVKSLY